MKNFTKRQEMIIDALNEIHQSKKHKKLSKELIKLTPDIPYDKWSKDIWNKVDKFLYKIAPQKH